MTEDKLAIPLTSEDALLQVRAYKAKVVGYIVDEPNQHAGALDFLRTLQTKIKEYDGARTGEKAPHLAAGREVDTRWEEPIGVMKDAKTELTVKILSYEDEQERLERERKAEIRRLELEAEAKKKAELEAEAKKMEIRQEPEAAAELRDMKHDIVAPPPPPDAITTPAPQPIAKVKGTARRETWSAEVRPEQKKLLARAIAAWNTTQEEDDKLLMPALYWVADEKALNTFADKTKGASPIDGVRFSSSKDIVAQKKGGKR